MVRSIDMKQTLKWNEDYEQINYLSVQHLHSYLFFMLVYDNTTKNAQSGVLCVRFNALQLKKQIWRQPVNEGSDITNEVFTVTF